MLIIWDTPIVVGIDEVIQKLRKVAYEKYNVDYFGNGLQSGNNIQYKCPFHKDGQERSSSFGIRIDDGRWHCFTCPEENEYGEPNGGDLPTLISRLLKLESMGRITPDLGFKWLLQQFNLALVGERPDIEVDISRGAQSSKATYVPQEEIDEYLSWSHPYMSTERHISEKIQEFLEIGFDEKTKSVVFIMRDLKGNPLYIKKRPVNPFNDARYINKKDVNKKNVMFGLWYLHKYKNVKPNEKILRMVEKYGLWVPEGEIDACSFWQAGAPGASIGGKIFFDTQIRLVQRVAPPFTVLALDNDEEGQNEMLRVSEQYERFVKFKYAKYPSWAKDMNDILREGKDIGVVKITNDYKEAFIR